MTRTKMIGGAALVVCALGYTGAGAMILATRLTEIETKTAVLTAAASATIGEMGLWVAAACLGLTIFRKRKAMLDRLFRRRPGVVADHSAESTV